jgi:NADH:ubiquinone oxidoreductase subunit 3 (subunit A)
MDKLLNPDADLSMSVQKLGTRLLILALIFMVMSLILLTISWNETAEIWFFLVALLIFILFENKAAFLQA